MVGSSRDREKRGGMLLSSFTGRTEERADDCCPYHISSKPFFNLRHRLRHNHLLLVTKQREKPIGMYRCSNIVLFHMYAGRYEISFTQL